MQRLTVPLPPGLNVMYRPNYNGRKGVRKTEICEAWERETQWLAKAGGCAPIKKPARVSMAVTIFYAAERDIDSSQKALQDCLQGFLYDDDSQINYLLITKEKDRANPRLEVRVWPAEEREGSHA